MNFVKAGGPGALVILRSLSGSGYCASELDHRQPLCKWRARVISSARVHEEASRREGGGRGEGREGKHNKITLKRYNIH